MKNNLYALLFTIFAGTCSSIACMEREQSESESELDERESQPDERESRLIGTVYCPNGKFPPNAPFDPRYDRPPSSLHDPYSFADLVLLTARTQALIASGIINSSWVTVECSKYGDGLMASYFSRYKFQEEDEPASVSSEEEITPQNSTDD